MTRRHLLRLAPGLLVLLNAPGCGRVDAAGPPTIVLGDTVCDECGMIVSDARFATATVVEGPRGAEARAFDDFNCQINYERAHPAEPVTARWSHDYLSTAWMPTEDASFLRSPGLRTPMGSGVAAFADRADADRTRRALAGDEPADTPGGEIMGFEAYWSEPPAGG